MILRPQKWFFLACLALLPTFAAAADAMPARPNILWLTCEDMSPHLGCYGDTYARSPTIDRLAADGVRYTNCFTHIGVCAPSRSGLITGMYPPSIGSHHMRSTTVLADYIKCYPQYLREAGYYCTNNSKTDYNFAAPKETWDESSNKAHWKNRPEGKPFFAIFNYTTTHESQIRAGKRQAEGFDPAKVPVPPYHPDTPIVRNDWARNYENIEKMDRQVAAALKELDDAGLADDTIVFFYSDHGTGMPRSKRWLYDSSTRVPLIIRYPKKWQTEATKAGTVTDELVAFVDLGPTVMSLAGVPTPKHMQGQAFLGPHKAAAPREYVYGCRDRMDERVDMIRSVRDKQYKYIRNYQWWKPYAQNINYMNEMPTMQEWRRLAAEGKLNPVQSLFMAPQKPREELYDCNADPHEVNNLVADPKHAEVLDRLRKAHEKWTEDIHDLGYLPEYVLHEFMDEGKNWRDESNAWPTSRALRQIQAFAEAQEGNLSATLTKSTPHPVPILSEIQRGVDFEKGTPDLLHQAAYIRASELLILEPKPKKQLLTGRLDLPSPATMLSVRLPIHAAAIFAMRDSTDDERRKKVADVAAPTLREGLKSDNPYLRHEAVLAIDDLGPQAVEFLDDIRAMLKKDNGYAARVGEFILSTREKK
jgi:uncharacterized sulfatase